MPGQDHFIVDDQIISLTKSDSAAFVTPAQGESTVNVAARLARSTRLALDTRATGSSLIVRGEANKIDEISTYSDVANVRFVYHDGDGNELALTNEILVAFEPGMERYEREIVIAEVGGVIVEAEGDLWRVRIPATEGDAPLTASNLLHELDGVRYAEPNALQQATFHDAPAPSDTRYSNQWHLENTGQGGGTPGADVSARGAWAVTTGSSGIRICVHDSGVDIDHPDLVANMNPGRDFDNGDGNASNDAGPHGTACAGVIAASQNGQGVVGVAPGCRIVPLRAAGGLTWDTWAETFKWAAKRSDIISCSWSITANNTLSAAIRAAANNGRSGLGIPIFFATGNSAPSAISYPANMSETIAVGASNDKDVRSSYSQFGAGLDFVAPSGGGASDQRIETTDVAGANGYNTAGGAAGDYCQAADATGFSGTSSATPLAAGVGALMLSANGNLSAAEVRQAMRDTADKIDPANGLYNAQGRSNQYGFGRVNAKAAVESAVRSRTPRAAGDAVVVWQDDRDRNGFYEIFARGLDVKGKQRFAERVVNSDPSGQQKAPSVGVAANGNFVVVWQDDTDRNDVYQIKARGLTADGNQTFADITVNTMPAGQQTAPDVAVAPNGDFVVVWQDDTDKNGKFQIFARGFKANGTQKFSDMTVNTVAAGQQLRPRVAMAKNGNFVVVWEDDQDENGVYQIHMRGFRSSGAELFNHRTVNSVAAGQQRRPRVAVAPNGHFVVVWEDDQDRNGVFDIWARGFNSSGNERFADQKVNTESRGNQRRPDVAISSTGDFIVVWEDDQDRNDFYEIMARGFDGAGKQRFADITVNTVSRGQQLRPAVAMTPTGESIVVWEDDQDRNGVYQIVARGLTKTGKQKFAQLTVNQVAAGQQVRPAIAMQPE